MNNRSRELKHEIMSNYLTTKEVTEKGYRDSYPFSVSSYSLIKMKDENTSNLRLFHSDVYFVRAAIEKNTGYLLPLPHVQALMREMGWRKR